MKTKAVRLYGANDLRLEEFSLPEIKDDEILARVVSDSICMSTYKAAVQGENHKRVPDDVAKNPIIVGHEFCGDIVKVGKAWEKKYKVGNRFVIQPALNHPSNVHAAPGYSFQYIGGAATYVIIPSAVMERNCLMNYYGDAYYLGSLAEPVSCVVGGFNVNYHSSPGSYVHNMGIVQGGKMALLAGVGPMGLCAIDYAIHCNRRPSLLVVTDIDEDRLVRASQIHTVEEAAKNGVELVYLNTAGMEDVTASLRKLAGGTGFDDVYVYAPVRALLKQASDILGYDGCLNFFAGPTDPNFSAEFNFYDVHYMNTHVVGNSGGNNDDLIQALELLSKKTIDASAMITHVGGLDAVIETIKTLPKIPGGKKLIYTHISMPLTAISDFAALGKTNTLFAGLAGIIEKNNGIWCIEAEDYLLKNATAI